MEFYSQNTDPILIYALEIQLLLLLTVLNSFLPVHAKILCQMLQHVSIQTEQYTLWRQREIKNFINYVIFLNIFACYNVI